MIYWSGDGIGLDEVFPPEAGTFNDDDLGVMQEAIEKCRGQRRVVVEDLRPALERAIGGQDDRSPLVTL